MQKTVQISEEELVAELRKWKEVDISNLKNIIQRRVREEQANKAYEARRNKEKAYKDRFAKFLRKTGTLKQLRIAEMTEWASSPSEVRERIVSAEYYLKRAKRDQAALSKAIPKLNEWLKHNRKLE
jgi:hypothetical protein